MWQRLTRRLRSPRLSTSAVAGSARLPARAELISGEAARERLVRRRKEQTVPELLGAS